MIEIKAYQILNARGVPTIEIRTNINGAIIYTSVPQGASKGKNEIPYLLDNNPKEYFGKSVYKAVYLLNNEIIPQTIKKIGKVSQEEFDKLLTKLTPWGNIRLAMSLTHLKISAFLANKALFEWIAEITRSTPYIPTPMFNIINGGAHAGNNLQTQEFMIVPSGIEFYPKQVQAGAEIFHTLKQILKDKGKCTGVGDEGGFAPDLKSDTQALDLIMQSIEKAGYKPYEEITIALDIAVSQYFKDSKYYVPHLTGKTTISSLQLIDFYKELAQKYPIISIEDGLAETDWEAWPQLTNTLMANNILSVGDDLTTTNPNIVNKALNESAISGIIIKPNQVGTISETLEVIKMSQDNGITCIASHRSGETNDEFIAHLATGTYTSFIKDGAPNRGERVRKYNELLRIHYLHKIN